MVDNRHLASLLRYLRNRNTGVSNKSLERSFRDKGVKGLSDTTIARLSAGRPVFQRSYELDAAQKEELRQQRRALLSELAGIWHRTQMPEVAPGITMSQEQQARIATYAYVLEHAVATGSQLAEGSSEPSYAEIDDAISVGWSAFQCDELQQICLYGAEKAYAAELLDRFIDYVTMALRAQRPAFNPNKLAAERWATALAGIIRPEIVSDPGVSASLAGFCREVSNWYLGASNASVGFDKWHTAGLMLARLSPERQGDLVDKRLLHNEGMRLYRNKDAARTLAVLKSCYDYFVSQDHPRQFRLSDETAENLLLIHILNQDASPARSLRDLLARDTTGNVNYWSEVGLQVTEALFLDTFYGKSERYRARRCLERADKLHRRCRIRLKPVLHLPTSNVLDRFISEPDTDRFEIFKGYRQSILEIGLHLSISHKFESIHRLLQRSLEEIKVPFRGGAGRS